MTIQTITITYDDQAIQSDDDAGTITTTDPNFPIGAAILFNDKDVQMQNPGDMTNETVLRACGTIAQQTVMLARQAYEERVRDAAVDAAVDFDGVGKGE